jgi:membrane fusion protein, copper/silver efflux system
MNMRIVLVSLLIVLAPVVMSAGTALAREHQAMGQEGRVKFYRNPMDPSVTSPVPMKDGMGMDYVPVYEDAPVAVEGVHITADQQQLIGVKTERVLRRPLALNIRASARVVLDKELYDAQTEYLGSNLVTSKRYNTSRQRLLNLGMGVDEIQRLKDKRWADRDLILTDLTDKVWVYASVYENEMGMVKPGQKAVLTAVAFPGETFSGVVTGVAQQLDPQNRTARVRIHVNNIEKRLRPEMFMTADIQVDLGEKLAVPAEAVIDTGKRKIVHVMTAAETFAPREVVLGHEASGFYEVIGGLEEGAQVVISGNFLVDAESQLKGNYDRKDN